MPDRGRILDLGCGPGDLAQALSGRGWQVWGADPSPDAIGPGRTLLGDRFFHGGVDAVELPAASLDAVVMNFSLEHSEDPRGELTQIARLLRPGGVVLIRVPNIDALLRGQRGARFQLRLPIHRCFFGPESLERLLESCGYEGVETETPLLLLSCASAAFEVAPGLDTEGWIHRPTAAGNALRAGALLALASTALPAAWAESRRGQGIILQTTARTPLGRSM